MRGQSGAQLFATGSRSMIIGLRPRSMRSEPVGMAGRPVASGRRAPRISRDQRLFLEGHDPLHLRALWRALCRVDRMPRRRYRFRSGMSPAAKPTRSRMRFLKALRVAGGTPQTPAARNRRPIPVRATRRGLGRFTYYGPGDIMPGSGYRKAAPDARTTPSIPRCASRSSKRRPTPIRNRS